MGGPQSDHSVCPQVYTGICRYMQVTGLEKFSGGGGWVGGPQSDYSVCPHPLGRG